jgi:hypothetical protein
LFRFNHHILWCVFFDDFENHHHYQRLHLRHHNHLLYAKVKNFFFCPCHCSIPDSFMIINFFFFSVCQRPVVVVWLRSWHLQGVHVVQFYIVNISLMIFFFLLFWRARSYEHTFDWWWSSNIKKKIPICTYLIYHCWD